MLIFKKIRETSCFGLLRGPMLPLNFKDLVRGPVHTLSSCEVPVLVSHWYFQDRFIAEERT